MPPLRLRAASSDISGLGPVYNKQIELINKQKSFDMELVIFLVVVGLIGIAAFGWAANYFHKIGI